MLQEGSKYCNKCGNHIKNTDNHIDNKMKMVDIYDKTEKKPDKIVNVVGLKIKEMKKLNKQIIAITGVVILLIIVAIGQLLNRGTKKNEEYLNKLILFQETILTTNDLIVDIHNRTVDVYNDTVHEINKDFGSQFTVDEQGDIKVGDMMSTALQNLSEEEEIIEKIERIESKHDTVTMLMDELTSYVEENPDFNDGLYSRAYCLYESHKKLVDMGINITGFDSTLIGEYGYFDEELNTLNTYSQQLQDLISEEKG